MAAVQLISPIVQGKTIVLDGAESFSPAGTRLVYSWRIAKAPAGSAAALDDVTKVRPRFTPDAAGDYTLELTVKSGASASAPVQVVVSTLNQAPTAKITVSRHPATGAYTLDARRSNAADGDALSYAWTLGAKPVGSAAAIVNPAGAMAQLSADLAGAYTVALTVTDARGKATVAVPVTLTQGQGILSANAGPDRRGQVGIAAWLDPFASTDAPLATGQLLSATWALVSAPLGSKAALGTEQLGRTPLTPDVAGDYVAQLTVTDGVSTAYDWVVVSVGATASVPPVANAGTYSQATLGGRVDLSATASTDLDGDLVAYSWAILSRPAGSTAAVAKAASPRASFTPDVAGLYAVQVQVRDQTGLASYATAFVSTNPLPPVADAGPDKLADANGQASVTAAGSTGDALAYKWTLLGYARAPAKSGDDSDPAVSLDSGAGACAQGDHYDDGGQWHSHDEQGGTATLTGGGSATIPKATIAAPTAVATTVKLDGGTIPLSQAVLLAPVSLPFTGTDAGAGGSGLRLTALGALASPTGTKTIWRIRNGSARCRTVTFAAVGFSYSARYTLPPATELTVASPYAIGTATHKLMESGVQRDLQAAAPAAFTDARPIGTGAQPTAYAVFEVVVSNANGSSADATLVTTGNVAPVAAISGPSIAITGSAVTLDGSGSNDANGTALTYRWSQIYRPTGSKTVLTGAAAAQASLTPDTRGFYIAQLIVNDGVLDSPPVTFVLNVPNRPPVFTSNPVTAAILNAGYTYALAATDPDNDPIAFSLVSGPPGLTLTGASVTWTPTSAGSYSVVLRASDGQGGVTDQSFNIAVAAPAGNLPPVMAAIGDKQVSLGNTLAFTVSATDPNGDAVSYGASPLPPGATLDAKTGAFSFTPTSATPATYAVMFSASDGKASSRQTVTITVIPDNPAALANVSGRVLDAIDFANGITTPVAGASIQIGAASTTSTAAGTFSLTGLTAGASALQASHAGYASASRNLTLYGSLTASVAPDILLLRVNGTGVAVNPASPTSVTAPTIAGVAVNVPAGSAKNPDGTPYTGTLTLVDVPPKAAGLPDTIRSCSVQTLAASGPVSFSPPARVTLPNRDALPPNTKVEIWALDPARGTYLRVAAGQVSADGASIATTLGGLSAATSFVVTPIAPESTASSIQPKDRWVPTLLGEGNVKAIAAMPGHQSVGQTRAQSLTYNSASADPRPVLSSIVNIDVRRGLPNALETQLYVNGVKIPDILVTNLAAPANPKDTGLSGTAEKLSRQITFDASFLATGAYPYRILTFAKYGCSSIASVETGRVFVNNRSASDVGRGWKTSDVQQVTIAPDGAAVIEEPDGSLTRFEAKKAITDFNRKPFRLTPNGGNYVVTADFDGDGKPDFAFTEEGTGNVIVYLNQGNGNFTRRWNVMYLAGGNPPPPEGTTYLPVATSLATGDVNGDGVPDLVITVQAVAGAAPGVYFAIGLGDGTFGPVTPLPGTQNTNYTSAQVVDLDGDGNPDLLVTEGLFNAPVIFWGNGDGTYVRGIQAFDGNVLRVIVRDLNGDGKPDLLYASGPFVYAYINKGARAFQQVVDVKNEYTPLTLLNQIVDVKGPNRVGQTDLVIAGNNNTLTVAYYDPTKGSFGGIGLRQSTPVPNGSGYISSVRFVDFDGTGAPGILLGLQNAGVASAAMMKGNADGSYGAPTALPLGHGTDANDVRDMDGDGGTDLVSLNRFDGYVDLSTIVNGKYVSPLPDFTTFEKQADGTYIRRYKDGSSVTFNAAGLQTAVTDPNGNATIYAYDSAGRLLTQTDPAGLATTYAYSGGKLASVTDPAGRTTRFALVGGLLQAVSRADNTTLGYAYDAAGRLTGQTDALGATTTNAYNAAGQLTQTTLPDGASVKLAVAKSLGTIDLSGPAPGPQNYIRPEDRVSTLTDPRGKVTTIQLNEWGGIVRTLDPLGRLTSYTRTPSNLVARIDAPSSVAPAPAVGTGGVTTPLTIGPGVTRNVTRFLAARLGLVIKASVTDPLAPPTPAGTVETAFQYDGYGNLVDVRKAAGTPIETRTAYEYEPFHNGVSKKTEWSYNPFSGPVSITTYAYDGGGNLTAATEIENVFGTAGATKSYTYDARGLKLTETDENGHTTAYTYDGNGNQLTMTNANGVVTRTVRDAAGNVVSQIDAEGTSVQRTVAFSYDALNRATSRTDGEGNTTLYAYDGNGNAVSGRDATGVVTARVFDQNNRLTSHTDPVSGTTALTYDGSGNLIQVTNDAGGTLTTAEYDDANRRIRTRDANGGVRLTTYDLSDNVIAQSDALGNTTSYAYDLLDRVVSRTGAAGGVWRFEYDARGLTTRAVKPSGISLDSSYDARKRLIIVASNFVFVRSYQYDAASNVTQLTEAGGALTYSYDALNRVATAGLPLGGISYAYDALNRVVSRTDETGAITATAYDKADRVTALTAPSGKVVARQYDAAGRKLREFWPNGQRTQHAFDTGPASGNTGRLLSIANGLDQAGLGGSALNQLLGTQSYAYDAHGNITGLSEPSRTQALGYDALNRLVTVDDQQPAPNPPVRTESYTLDAEGNRIASHLSSFHVTAPANRLIEDATAAYAYDPDGNMVTKTIKATGRQWRYAYDVFNRLQAAEVYASAGASAYDSRVEYAYDGLDNRVLRRELAAGGGAVRETRYQNDGRSIASLAETAFGATGAVSKRQWYTLGETDQIAAITPNASGAINQPGTASLYASRDNRGSVRALTDDAGQVISQASYDSYGNPRVSVDGITPQPYRYTGREYDATTGLYNYRSREYDAGMGRFLQEDRIWGKSHTLNYYRYVRNNPVRFTDPAGESELVEYACLASFALNNGADVGTSSAIAFGRSFIPIVKALEIPDGVARIENMIAGQTIFAAFVKTYDFACGVRDVVSYTWGGGSVITLIAPHTLYYMGDFYSPGAFGGGIAKQTGQ